MFATHKNVLTVIQDGSRIDRYVEKGSDGKLFLTTKNEKEEQIFIPFGLNTNLFQERKVASTIIRQAKGLAN
jgi:hypothetical protein